MLHLLVDFPFLFFCCSKFSNLTHTMLDFLADFLFRFSVVQNFLINLKFQINIWIRNTCWLNNISLPSLSKLGFFDVLPHPYFLLAFIKFWFSFRFSPFTSFTKFYKAVESQTALFVLSNMYMYWLCTVLSEKKIKTCISHRKSLQRMFYHIIYQIRWSIV